MNTIWIVMPILVVLMFLLGIDISKKSFTDIAHNPKAVLLGLTGQLVILPVLAFSIAWILKLPPVYFMGLVHAVREAVPQMSFQCLQKAMSRCQSL